MTHYFKNTRFSSVYFGPLFFLNKLRLDYILKRTQIKNKLILDIGCGCGLLSEKLALHGGIVTGIDKSVKFLELARNSAKKKKIKIEYIHGDIEFFRSAQSYDIIICTEFIEHLYNKDMLVNFFNKFVNRSTVFFISSLEKVFLTYLKIIYFGEYVCQEIPKNTHHFELFMNILKLKDFLLVNHLYISDVKYLNYNFILNSANLLLSNNINYLIEMRRENK